MDTFGLISDFLTAVKYTVTRRVRATLVKGRTIQGTATTFNILASVQPASGRDLQRLPEGRRTQETCVLFTTTLLQPGGQMAAKEADRVSIDGVSWEVQQVETWRHPTGPTYYRCILQSSQT